MNSSDLKKTIEEILENFGSIMTKLDENEHQKLFHLLKNCQSEFKKLLSSEKNEKVFFLKIFDSFSEMKVTF